MSSAHIKAGLSQLEKVLGLNFPVPFSVSLGCISFSHDNPHFVNIITAGGHCLWHPQGIFYLKY